MSDCGGHKADVSEEAHMGVSMVYQAIPPQSALFRSVQENAACHALLAWFYPLGMFSLITPLDAEQAEEMIEEILEA